MPTWTPQWQDVRFDHAAAVRLVAEAEAVAARLALDADARGELAASALADWSGRRAAAAAPRLRALPYDLDDLARDLRTLAASVEHAAADARAEQARREDDRRRWYAARAAEEEAARDAREAAMCGGRP